MNFIKNLKIRNKLAGSFGLAVLLMALVGGLSIYQMHQGDSIHVAIRHDMKREILPGVSDIGIKISKIQ